MRRADRSRGKSREQRRSELRLEFIQLRNGTRGPQISDLYIRWNAGAGMTRAVRVEHTFPRRVFDCVRPVDMIGATAGTQ